MPGGGPLIRCILPSPQTQKQQSGPLFSPAVTDNKKTIGNISGYFGTWFSMSPPGYHQKTTV